MSEIPSNHYENGYEQERVLAQLALDRTRDLVNAAASNPDENTVTIDWLESQQHIEIASEEDLYKQANRDEANSEINALYTHALYAEDPFRDEDDELKMLLNDPNKHRIIKGVHAVYEYLDDKMQHIQFNYTEVDIEGIGIAKRARIGVHDGGQQKSYMLTDTADGELHGYAVIDELLGYSNEKVQKIVQEILEPLPLPQKLRMHNVLSGNVAFEDVDVVLESIEEACRESVDPAVLAKVMKQAEDILDAQMDTYLSELAKGSPVMRTEDLTTMLDILDKKERDLLN